MARRGSGAQLWVLRSTLTFKAIDATLAPGEGMTCDHTFYPRRYQRKLHVPLSYQLSPLDVVGLDLGPSRDRGQDQVLAQWSHSALQQPAGPGRGAPTQAEAVF